MRRRCKCGKERREKREGPGVTLVQVSVPWHPGSFSIVSKSEFVSTSRPTSAHLTVFSLRNSPRWALIVYEDSEESSLHPNPEEFDDTSQDVFVWGVTEKGVLPLPYPVGANRHQSFNVCKNGYGTRMQP